jgi:hypothetical protein
MTDYIIYKTKEYGKIGIDVNFRNKEHMDAWDFDELKELGDKLSELTAELKKEGFNGNFKYNWHSCGELVGKEPAIRLRPQKELTEFLEKTFGFKYPISDNNVSVERNMFYERMHDARDGLCGILATLKELTKADCEDVYCGRKPVFEIGKLKLHEYVIPSI